jgi:adenine deaminase
MKTKTVQGYLADIASKRFRPVRMLIRGGKIEKVESIPQPEDDIYILPGLVDSHIHIESSMLSPQQFSSLALAHGTVATVSDPHEIANVLGKDGIEFMVRDGNRSPLKFHFGVPSCVPSTPFETAGAIIDSRAIEELISDERFKYLAEMMNFPGVINQDEEVVRKLQLAREYGKPIDGHAPGVRGEDLEKYVSAGISTDHECHDYDEALEKIRAGMTIQIREGSAARDFDALYPLIDQYPGQVMLCSDDRHPNDLIRGHIDELIRKGLSYGLNFFNLLQAATWNPVKHYGLDVGLLQEGDPADFILVDDPDSFKIRSVYIEGQQVYDQEKVLYEPLADKKPNVMNPRHLMPEDFKVKARSNRVRVIHALDNQLFTSSSWETLADDGGLLHSDTEKDVLKVAVVNRYQPQLPSVGFIRNFGLKKGAIATSIAHDSHNLLVVGVGDNSIAEAIRLLREQKGGIVVYDGNQGRGLPLEIAGLMTHRPGREVAARYEQLTEEARILGCTLEAPFMTLSFMALPVIPELKITDQGLFDVTTFQHTGLFADE